MDTTLTPSASFTLQRSRGVELALEDLLRMDTQTRTKAATEAMASGMSPNEVRRRFHDLPPVKGGESPLAQQQNFSLPALAERDADKPFSKAPTPPGPPVSTASETEDALQDDEVKAAVTEYFIRKELAA